MKIFYFHCNFQPH